MNPEAIVESFGLQSGMKVADFGSGSGYFTILMAKKVGDSGQVTAVDILESALETVRAKASVSGLKNLQTIRADLEVLPIVPKISFFWRIFFFSLLRSWILSTKQKEFLRRVVY